MLRLSETPIDSIEELRAFKAGLSGSGAVVSFTGIVRETAHQSNVKSLFLQAYRPMTDQGISAAIEQAKTRWPLEAVTIVHRIGEVASSDDIVFVATASAHRRAAFEAADFLMDYLKTKAVFWKKEVTDKGEVWIEPRADDYEDSRRWDASSD